MTRWRPGDRKPRTASMIRVDQAGEYGATRIYAGQLAIMGDRTPAAREIAGMARQEQRHRAFFDKMVADRGVRPTLLQPFWNIAGFALGAATAAIGPEAAMACTAAVETEIDNHYSEQLQQLAIAIPHCRRRSRNSGRGGRARDCAGARSRIGAGLSADVGIDPAGCRVATKPPSAFRGGGRR